VARLSQVLNVIHEALGADERECVDVRVRQVSPEARRCREQRATLRDDIVDQHNPMDWGRREHCRE
jgi:hypothetical protein